MANNSSVFRKVDNKEDASKSGINNENVNKNEVVKIKVKYSLNKLKNLEVAKANVLRPIKVDRIVTNDTNVRYEMNSGQYLHIKEEMKQYKKGDLDNSENGEITFRAEKNSFVEDINDNNPGTQVKMVITNNKTKETTNVVIKLYHTNQSIHLQGGRRMGKTTSTFMLADCMESYWRRNMTENASSINEANECIKSMVIKPGMATRARTSSGDPILNCDKCSYSCELRHRLNIHKISMHSKKKFPLKITAVKRKSSPTKAPEIQRIAKEKITKTVESVESVPEINITSFVRTYPCTDCGFVYNSETDLACHISIMHADLTKKKDQEGNTEKKQEKKLENEPAVIGHSTDVEKLNVEAK